MGADFNILEYADPEALPGEKTNILDLELEEEPIKNDKKVKVEVPKVAPVGKPNSQLKKEVNAAATGITGMVQSQNHPSNVHPPPLAISQTQNVSVPINNNSTTNPPMTPQQIYQSMLLQMQQAAAGGNPMPVGTRLQAPEGIVGIVTSTNNIQLQVPQSYHQRLLLLQQSMYNI